MSCPSEMPKCFCKCYNMLAWEKTFKTADIHVNEKPYSCGRCQKGFSPDDNIIVHNLIHTLDVLNTLNIFNKSAVTKMYLTTYNIIHGNKIQCSTGERSNTNVQTKDLVQCNEKPGDKIDTSDSECSDHTVANPYPCAVCDKTFKEQSHLTTHNLVHVKEKLLHRCSKCSSMFVHKQHLASHKQLHKYEIPYCCSLCEKIFRDKYSLATHVRSHYVENNKNSYSRNICEKSFPSKSDIIQHLNSHAIKSPCNMCERVHKLKNGFEFFYCVHTGGKRHVCSICNKRFLRKRSLHSHLRMHSERPYSCNVCKSAYTNINSLNGHYSYFPTHKSLQASTNAVAD